MVHPVSPLDIAVIGGSGFIGTELVGHLLKSGHRVRIGDIAPSRVYPDLHVRCDIRDLEGLVEFLRGTDVVYNLAAHHRDDVWPRALYYDVNVGGARNLCEAAERLDLRRLVFTSSVSVYGLSRAEVDEDGPKRPFNDYGRSKLGAERVMREWFRHGSGRTLVIVRPTVVFGPGSRGNVYELMRWLASNPYLMIGRGKNLKAVAYVGNVAAFLEFVLAFDGQGEQVINYVDREFDMETLVRLVRTWSGRNSAPLVRLPYSLAYGIGAVSDVAARLSGRQLPISAVRVRKFCGNTRYSPARMLSLGFRPPADAEQALERTFRAEFASDTPRSEPGQVTAQT
jgi:nucleoside-diphosphate-sugar epimerase